MSLVSVPGTHNEDISEPDLLEACYHLGNGYFKFRLRYYLNVHINHSQ